jgi:hypothetical protein
MLIKTKIKQHATKIDGVTNQYTSHAPTPRQRAEGTHSTEV